MSDDLRQARVDLAAAFRLAVRNGFDEGICNHFSVLAPGASDRFLINPQGLHWSEITASSLALVDSAGSTIEGRGAPEPTALYIHWRLHRSAPRARCVLHTHMPYATTLTTLLDARVEPISQSALQFFDRVAYDEDYNGLALDASEGDRIAAKLGNRSVLFLANHGVVVTGTSVAHAFNDLYYLERACQLQVLAMSTGRPLRRVPEEVARRTAEQFARDNEAQVLGHFEALKRLLDRDQPGYRD